MNKVGNINNTGQVGNNTGPGPGPGPTEPVGNNTGPGPGPVGNQPSTDEIPVYKLGQTVVSFYKERDGEIVSSIVKRKKLTTVAHYMKLDNEPEAQMQGCDFDIKDCAIDVQQELPDTMPGITFPLLADNLRHQIRRHVCHTKLPKSDFFGKVCELTRKFNLSDAMKKVKNTNTSAAAGPKPPIVFGSLNYEEWEKTVLSVTSRETTTPSAANQKSVTSINTASQPKHRPTAAPKESTTGPSAADQKPTAAPKKSTTGPSAANQKPTAAPKETTTGPSAANQKPTAASKGSTTAPSAGDKKLATLIRRKAFEPPLVFTELQPEVQISTTDTSAPSLTTASQPKDRPTAAPKESTTDLNLSIPNSDKAMEVVSEEPPRPSYAAIVATKPSIGKVAQKRKYPSAGPKTRLVFGSMDNFDHWKEEVQSRKRPETTAENPNKDNKQETFFSGKVFEPPLVFTTRKTMIEKPREQISTPSFSPARQAKQAANVAPKPDSSSQCISMAVVAENPPKHSNSDKTAVEAPEEEPLKAPSSSSGPKTTSSSDGWTSITCQQLKNELEIAFGVTPEIKGDVVKGRWILEEVALLFSKTFHAVSTTKPYVGELTKDTIIWYKLKWW